MAVAQLVEHLIAIQKVAGSNPVSHSRSHIEGYGRRGARWIELAVNADSPCSSVDMTSFGGCRQVVKAADCGSAIREFESHHPPHTVGVTPL